MRDRRLASGIRCCALARVCWSSAVARRTARLLNSMLLLLLSLSLLSLSVVVSFFFQFYSSNSVDIFDLKTKKWSKRDVASSTLSNRVSIARQDHVAWYFFYLCSFHAESLLLTLFFIIFSVVGTNILMGFGCNLTQTHVAGTTTIHCNKSNTL
jgi:hypothetical protein